jgi:hypothetical protein
MGTYSDRGIRAIPLKPARQRSAFRDLSLLKTLSDDARLAARSRLTQIVTLSSRDSISWVTQNPCDSAQR